MAIVIPQPTAKHCTDVFADRKLGEYWEREFCKMAAELGYCFTPMQIGKSASATFETSFPLKKLYTLPDVTIWTYPGQHHEIKHKSPTRSFEFGLEEYRLNALVQFAHETQQAVMYTIHNHALSGGRECRLNNIAHWVTANALDLRDRGFSRCDFGDSWVNGRCVKVRRLYWPITFFTPLRIFWANCQNA